jgi:EAL domain-containing protein (putative c-di-GMP-specific phosphodiesterase class I)
VCRLKIDQSFIRDIPADQDDRAIAMAVISLGHMLNLKVIAEGVETEQQLAFLRENECDEAQGYHFGRPVSSDEIVPLLHRSEKLRSVVNIDSGRGKPRTDVSNA